MPAVSSASCALWSAVARVVVGVARVARGVVGGARVVVGGVVIGGVGCAGPAAVVTVNIEEGADLQTDEVTGFLVRFGQDEEAIAIDRTQQIAIPFQTAPPGDTEVVVFACEGNAACSVAAATFAGCDVVTVNEGDLQVVATVLLFPLATPEPACAAIINGE